MNRKHQNAGNKRFKISCSKLSPTKIDVTLNKKSAINDYDRFVVVRTVTGKF